MCFKILLISLLIATFCWSCLKEPKDNIGNTPMSEVLSQPIPVNPVHSSMNTPLSVLLEWKESKSTNGSPVFYEVRFNGENGNIIWGRDLTETNLFVHNLKPNKTYSWSVVADDHKGNRKFSNKFSFTTGNYTAPVMDIVYDFQEDSPYGIMNYTIKKGSHEITELGVCWSTKELPTIEDHVISFTAGNVSGVATFPIEKDTLYFIRSFIISEAGITYGKLKKIPAIEDSEKNEYHYVQIFNQTWMAENLRSTLRPDGTKLAALSRGNDSIFIEKYGLAYTFASANNLDSLEKTQGICPEGWHLPSRGEFIELFNNLGGIEVAGGKLKNAELKHWLLPNTGASNQSRFNALPTGFWSRSYMFEPNWTGLYSMTGFWTSSLDTTGTATNPIYFSLRHDGEEVSEQTGITFFGVNDNYFCIRCIKD